MSDFIDKLNVILQWIGNAEKTRSNVEVISRTGTQSHTNTDREVPFQKGVSHTKINANTNTSKQEK